MLGSIAIIGAVRSLETRPIFGTFTALVAYRPGWNTALLPLPVLPYLVKNVAPSIMILHASALEFHPCLSVRSTWRPKSEQVATT